MDGIKMNFRGVDYTIPPHRLFPIGEAVEEIATLSEITTWVRAPKFYKMARCIGAMLRFAGADVTDLEVKEELSAQFGSDGGAVLFTSSLMALIQLLMGGAPKSEDGEAPEK
jgi:hypothetical protein